MDFDVVEVFRGKRIDKFREVSNDWYALAKGGYMFPGVAGSGSTNISKDEVGYPRTYVKSSEDDPSEIDIDEIVANIKNGKSFMTNGPIVNYKVGKSDYGDFVTPPKTGIIFCD